MGYSGKIIGVLVGMAIFRLPGALLGLIVGHLFDVYYAQDFSRQGGFARFFSSKENIQKDAVFFHALFSAFGHVCKADGKVTSDEIKVASKLMDDMGLAGDIRLEAQQAFREGKERDFPLTDMLKGFREHAHGRTDILQVFIEILIAAAFADGRLTEPEIRILQKVALGLGFSQVDLQFMITRFEAAQRFRQGSGFHQRQSGQKRQYNQEYNKASALNDAYKILGVSANQPDIEVKRAYKKLMAQHHPDKLASKGLPQQALEMANKRTQEIQSAYELIKEQRGI
ncbi:co-chaperone DjlA [Glaciecola sp. XM2]|jgi:DnaJ like chaperone protein|uniref:co-chaperone DjlA n=1 Tax=Glaciecola sp. XM2 TaxID=1914931 RepID=UPI001BDEC66A|nr:co-chaperone DjlA [Glaciecola sp. XM2]MBT1451057.1 co-chaperone DjlA [Glaciecola sp. XM2]